MAYQGYLIKVGDYKIPYEYMNGETYLANRNVQDVDSYRDSNGKLHRETLTHVPCSIEFETPPLHREDLATLLKSIQANYSHSMERKAEVTAFIPEKDDYVMQDMYMPDPKITIANIENGDLWYKPVKLEFIGY